MTGISLEFRAQKNEADKFSSCVLQLIVHKSWSCESFHIAPDDLASQDAMICTPTLYRCLAPKISSCLVIHVFLLAWSRTNLFYAN